MRRKDDTKYVFCTGSKDNKTKKDEPKGERYDFRSKWGNDPTGTKRYELYETVKKKQGSRSSISFDEIREIAKKILAPYEQNNSKVRAYITDPKKNRGFMERNGVRRVS